MQCFFPIIISRVLHSSLSISNLQDWNFWDSIFPHSLPDVNPLLIVPRSTPLRRIANCIFWLVLSLLSHEQAAPLRPWVLTRQAASLMLKSTSFQSRHISLCIRVNSLFTIHTCRIKFVCNIKDSFAAAKWTFVHTLGFSATFCSFNFLQKFITLCRFGFPFIFIYLFLHLYAIILIFFWLDHWLNHW